MRYGVLEEKMVTTDTTKPSAGTLGLSSIRRSKMCTILISSWQIMPSNDALLPQISDPICDQELSIYQRVVGLLG